MNETIDVLYISVWNGGFEIVSNATYDVMTGEVSNIITEENEYVEENCDDEGDELEFLDGQYIEFKEGVRAEVEDRDDGLYVKEDTRTDAPWELNLMHIAHEIRANGELNGIDIHNERAVQILAVRVFHDQSYRDGVFDLSVSDKDDKTTRYFDLLWETIDGYK